MDAVGLPARTDGKPTVLSIRQALIERAVKAREKVTPPNHCPTCHKHHCRLLYIGCCICTGHISQDAPRPFPKS
jgi:hypothetical protein